MARRRVRARTDWAGVEASFAKTPNVSVTETRPTRLLPQQSKDVSDPVNANLEPGEEPLMLGLGSVFAVIVA